MRRNAPKEIRLMKLSAPAGRAGGPLTDKEVAAMMRQGVLRASHYLWLAEQYMMDLSKLGAGPELDERLAELSAVCRHIEGMVDALFSSRY